jgi:hypothetical protein
MAQTRMSVPPSLSGFSLVGYEFEQRVSATSMERALTGRRDRKGVGGEAVPDRRGFLVLLIRSDDPYPRRECTPLKGAESQIVGRVHHIVHGRWILVVSDVLEHTA